VCWSVEEFGPGCGGLVDSKKTALRRAKRALRRRLNTRYSLLGETPADDGDRRELKLMNLGTGAPAPSFDVSHTYFGTEVLANAGTLRPTF